MPVAKRVGFIGSGGVAERHATTLLGIDGVAVVGVTSLHLQHAQRFADRFSATAYATVDQMLDGTGCDLVYICVPPDAHGDIEEQVLERELPFFVEKPLARDLETAERIAEAVRRSGVTTATGYHWRYSGSVERARALLEEHPPLIATAQWLDRAPPPEWWHDPTRSGGQVIEQATHLLDTLRVLLGEVSDVCATASDHAGQDGQGVDTAVVSALRFRSGAAGSLSCTSAFEGPKHVGIDVVCEDLWIRVREDRVERLDGEAPEVWHNRHDPRELVDRAFIDKLRGVEGAKIRAPYDEALLTQRLAWAVTSAARLRNLELPQ